VDQVPSRLAKAKFIGAIPINFRENDPVKEIVKLESNGVDQSIDYCGFECVNRRGEKVPNTVLTWAVKVTRESGGIGVIGVYVPFGDSGQYSPSFHSFHNRCAQLNTTI
jgi:threonine dehydrogenase-like Zn-dependent dehydrogenase